MRARSGWLAIPREATSDEVKGLRTEAQQLKELLAEVLLETACSKKCARRWGVRYMRYAAAEKLEIIRLVEQSPLPVRRTLIHLGISRATFYRWYRRYLARGAVALADGQPAPRRAWNKLPDALAATVIDLALKEPEWSPRELATAFVDQQQYFVSEASVYRLLKARGLITSPAFILLKAADHFAQPTTAINQLWQTDFSAP
jgi:putative transposase